MGNAGCASHGWSIISSASTNSQLAGLLAGFVFAGVIILIALRGYVYTQALGLFSATFIVLAFDSYLFSVIAGSDQDPNCARVWSLGMAASGMLAVGAAGLASAMCWLMVAHVDGGSGQDGGEAHRQALAHLGRVTRLATLGVVVGVALQLARTTSEYLVVVYEKPAVWILCSTLAVPGLVITAVLLLPTLRRGFTRRSRGRRDAARYSRNLHQASIPFATFGSVAYGTLTPVFAGVMTGLPPSWWESGSVPLVATTAVVNSAIPGVLLVAHVLAAPLGGGRWLHPEQPPA